MIFQNKIDKSMKELHDTKVELDGHLTEEEVEEIKEKLDAKDYFAMTISALLVFLPVALILLVLLAVCGYFFIVR